MLAGPSAARPATNVSFRKTFSEDGSAALSFQSEMDNDITNLPWAPFKLLNYMLKANNDFRQHI